jgi:PAP_fibrillin
MTATIKDDLLALLDSQDANGGFSDDGFRRLGELVEAIRAESPYPEPMRTLEPVEGRWEATFAHFGVKHSAAKTRIHDSTLAMQSWNRFPASPIRVLRICQEISRQGNAYNNVIDFTSPDGGVEGTIVVRGVFRGEDGNPQRFVVDFVRLEILPRGATSAAALRAGLGLTADEPLVADMKPPKLSSDVIYLDDTLRINVGSLGGLYLLRRSDEPAISIG